MSPCRLPIYPQYGWPQSHTAPASVTNLAELLVAGCSLSANHLETLFFEQIYHFQGENCWIWRFELIYLNHRAGNKFWPAIVQLFFSNLREAGPASLSMLLGSVWTSWYSLKGQSAKKIIVFPALEFSFLVRFLKIQFFAPQFAFVAAIPSFFEYWRFLQQTQVCCCSSSWVVSSMHQQSPFAANLVVLGFSDSISP